MDIDAFVCHATLLHVVVHDGTRVYRFSKELLAFLQTLVAFCPYYVAIDPNTAGLMDNYYAEALRDYSAVTYEALHRYLIEGLRYWYRGTSYFRPRRRGGGPMSTKQMHRSRLRTHVRALSCA